MRRDPGEAEQKDGSPPRGKRGRKVPREARALPPRDHAPRGEEPGADPDEHGVTAEDRGGVGFAEEGFRAEDYPGHNPLHGESAREREHRQAYTWTWPLSAIETEAEARTDAGAPADRHICGEIGARILKAQPALQRVVVRVLDGHVTLEGEVAERGDEYVIEALAANVEGVRSVASSLVVGPSGEGPAG